MAHVGVPGGTGKSVSKNSPVGGVEFDLPGCSPAGLLEAEIESADAGEEGAKGFAVFIGTPRLAEVRICQFVFSGDVYFFMDADAACFRLRGRLCGLSDCVNAAVQRLRGRRAIKLPSM